MKVGQDVGGEVKVTAVYTKNPDKTGSETITFVEVISISAEPEIVCLGTTPVFTVVTSPDEEEYHKLVSIAYDPNTPGAHEVIAECGTSSAATTVTVVKLEIKGSPQVADDGLSTEVYFECEVTPDTLEPSSYQWYASWDTPAYNDPQVTFTLPTDSITRMANAWWYATTTDPCVTDHATYYIYCSVQIDRFICSNAVPALFHVTIPGEYDHERGVMVAGITHFPSHTKEVHIYYIETNGYYEIVGVDEPWNRIDAEIEIFVAETSQFYDKVWAHENQHKKDHDDGFDEYQFIQMDEFDAIIVGTTSETIQGLKQIVQEQIVQYVQEEQALIDSLRDILEERAYAVSDKIPPFYVYQGVCEGY